MKSHPWSRRLSVASAVLLLLGLVVHRSAASRVIAPSLHPVGQPPRDLNRLADRVSSASGADISFWYLDVEGAKGTVLLLHPAHDDRRAMLGCVGL